MKQKSLDLATFACGCIVAISGAFSEQVIGGQGTAKEPVRVAVVDPQKPLSRPSQKPPAISQTKKSIARADPEASVPRLKIRQLPKEFRTTTRKGPPPVKALKKVTPKAVVQPRTDLIHYGMLEDLQRYDPRPHTDSAAVRSPQTPELTHDHFQELDRNQDGMIDPVERALGRIDMDRDLNDRRFR